MHSLTRLATSERFLLGDDLGEFGCDVASLLDGVFNVLGEFAFFSEEDAILDAVLREDWV